MNIQEEILKKYEEFANFLKSIHIQEWKLQYSRQELKEFQSKLDKIKIPSFSFELSKVMDEMKKEEYPQLLGVHHYPDLNDIDFMSEAKKIELDKHLCMIRKGHYVFQFWKYTNDTKRLQEFLLEKGIIGRVYHMTCPHHSNEVLTDRLTWEQVEEIKKAIIEKDHDFLEDFYDGLYCDRCEDCVEYKDWEDYYVKEQYVLIKDRDTSLDKV